MYKALMFRRYFRGFPAVGPVKSGLSAKWLLLAGNLLTTSSLAATGVAASDNLPPHPRLLLNQKGIAALKARIETMSWAKGAWEELKQTADKDLTHPIVLPPRGGNWSHNYVCPTHGARLSQGRKIDEWRWEHICPVGHHVLLGDPAHRDGAAGAVHERDAEVRLAFEDARRVVAERAVAEVAVVRLGGVEPLVDREVVLRLAAVLARRRDGVVPRVSH